MPAEQQMLFPFTNRDEILDWATLYTDTQTSERQHQEEDVRKIRENVEARKKPETPGGYLTKPELRRMAGWKRYTLPSLIDNNPDGHVEKITTEAFRPGDDWEKLKKLISYYEGLAGVRESVASVILHLYDDGDYPVLDEHALWSLTIDNTKVAYDEPFWKKYVEFCRAKAKCHGVCMRTLDRALYKFSENGAASALKNISSDMFFLQLKRRMNQNTRNAFASDGLDILKRAVLLVLYEAKQESPYGTILTAGEIRERLDLPYQRFPSGNVNALTQGVLDHLKQERHASHDVGYGWSITEQGVSLIED